MSVTCTTHPTAVAHYRCDGCRRFLCEECFEQGHRLVFCVHCRERGIALDPATPDERSRARKHFRERSYTLQDAMLYPFRGSGSLMLWSYFGLILALSLVRFVPIAGQVGGCISAIWTVFVLWLIPGTLFSIVRTTERGENELPDWPDFFDTGGRFREVLGFVLAMIVSLTPGMVLVQAIGCSAVEWATRSASLFCWGALAVHMALATAIWVPMFGAIGVFDEAWIGLRFDSHLRAIRAMGSDFWTVCAILVGLLLGGQVLSYLLLSTLGALAILPTMFVGLYTVFVGAHLVGVLFREHHDAVDAIYWR